MPSLELHHTGYVVDDLDASLSVWRQAASPVTVTEPVVVTADNVKVCFLEYAGGRAELIEHLNRDRKPAMSSTSQPHHVCFLCGDFDDRIARARNEGGVVVRPPVASEAFAGRRMCFVLYRHAGLIEWVEQ